MHPIAVDPRDTGEEWRKGAGRHGQARSCVTVHIPGVTDRDTVARNLHRMISAAPPVPGESSVQLCGVEHVGDVGIWQVPHTGRAQLRRELARLGAHYRRPIVIVEGYQHLGPCPTTERTA